MEFGSALVFILAVLVCSATYTRLIVQPMAPGLPRFLAYSPVLAINIYLPSLFSTEGLYVFGRMISAYLVAWLASNKVLGMCLNRGPLVPRTGGMWNLRRFIAIYALPVMPSTEQLSGWKKVEECAKLLFRTAVTSGMQVVCILLISPDPHDASIKNTLAMGFWVYFFLGTMFAQYGFISLVVFDLTTADSFVSPYFATSVSDFWGRRWNMMTAEILRSVSYDPIMEGRLVAENNGKGSRPPKAPEWKKAVAVIAIFAFSGICHELYIWVAHGLLDVRMFLYFFIYGFVLLGERKMRGTSIAKSIPRHLSVPITFSITLLMGWLFFIPVLRRADVGHTAANVKVSLFGEA